MEINKNIFKSYDVRGIYPSELNDEVVFNIGRSFIKLTGAKSVVICQDARISSPSLFKAFAGGVATNGAKVLDIGQGPTELAYFALGKYNFDSAVMITASHNPKEYNGLKMMKISNKHSVRNIEMVRGVDILPEINLTNLTRNGKIKIEKKDVWYDYLNHILSFVDLDKIAPLKIVVDASNGVAGLAISRIESKLPVKIIALNFEPNGDFPNHSPNPLEKDSAEQISKEIKKQKADFGFIFDADADRVFLVDELGELVRADATLLLLAKYFLKKNPGMAIAYNAICSKAVPKFIKKWGGIPVRTQVGFVNVRDGLLKNNGVMGGELSGHYCFKNNYYMDSGMIAFLVLLQIISKDGHKVSEIIKKLTPYAKGAELNFKVENKETILEKVKDKYKDGEQDFLDGITVEYKDWWFNVRPSNTEPLLRLTIEADNKSILDIKTKELKNFISSKN